MGCLGGQLVVLYHLCLRNERQCLSIGARLVDVRSDRSEEVDRMRTQPIVGTVMVLVLAGCGSGSTTPIGPGGAPVLSGTWVQASGDTRTWVLEQGSFQAGGTASFSSGNYPGLGEVTGTGYVLGAAILGGFRFEEVYETLQIPSKPSPNNCHIDTEGHLSVGGNAMTGTVTETLGCAGVQVSKVTRDLVMRRR